VRRAIVVTGYAPNRAARSLVTRRTGRVPEDVAVVGFDDSPPALACRPQLTTVRQPVEAMAAEMARLVLSHIDDPAHDRAR
jgi:DNA-binding LacI/PurR family transcriptional regulator